ncbi:M14 family metallopeptidase [Draconibacterium sp. IB214405]|uniref:M14 family metallopeptidase n=1 Tax=Draconibacterium sp. IB214405 TaxID=3097352 RepID=UPI002A0AA900|nr:M14 family metallopeptidase [Draconibacterium sp. IB214405]MDX8340965.1 M14 family metallopeptidase [Draconibacterium sp. IB214405]
MKKFLKVAGAILVVLIVVVLGYSYVSFNTYSPTDPDVDVDKTKLSYYQDTWEECRAAFRSQANSMKTRMDSVLLFSKAVESKTDAGLTIDFCYIPAKDTTEKLVMICSGTHGIEGFVGSAVQQQLMAEFFKPEMFSTTGVLLVHGLNAWGFKNQRRFTENNVDLNRNYSTDRSLFETKNDGFVALYDMLTPKGELNMNSISNKFFLVTAINQIARKGMPALLQAFAQGQYEFQEGIYFGGKDFEQQVAIMSEVLTDIAASYSILLNLDLHTGFGERGELHLFPNPIDDPELKAKTEAVFDGYPINWGDSDNFYTVHGQFVEFIGDLLPGKTSIPMLMEFGTLNTGSTIGAVKSAHISIAENQGAHYGYKSEKDSLKALAGYYEMFYPPSEKWRSNALTLSQEMMGTIWENFQELE